MIKGKATHKLGGAWSVLYYKTIAAWIQTSSNNYISYKSSLKCVSVNI